MKMGSLPDALEPGFHCVGTHWNWGFMTFQLVRCTPCVMLSIRSAAGTRADSRQRLQ
jgi:hypothetical protein